jgi:hypothetical protein
VYQVRLRLADDQLTKPTVRQVRDMMKGGILGMQI